MLLKFKGALKLEPSLNCLPADCVFAVGKVPLPVMHAKLGRWQGGFDSGTGERGELLLTESSLLCEMMRLGCFSFSPIF